VGETRQIAGLVIITLILGIVGLALISIILPLLSGDLAVRSY